MPRIRETRTQLALVLNSARNTWILCFESEVEKLDHTPVSEVEKLDHTPVS